MKSWILVDRMQNNRNFTLSPSIPFDRTVFGTAENKNDSAFQPSHF